MRDRLPPRPSDEALNRLERTAGQLAAGAVVAAGSVIAGRFLAYTHDALDVVEEVQRASERSGVSALDIALGLATGDIDIEDVEAMNDAADGGIVIDVTPNEARRLPSPPPKQLPAPKAVRTRRPPTVQQRPTPRAYRQGEGLADDDPSRW